MTLEEKKKALAKVKGDIEKKHGKGMLIKASDVEPIEFYSTGIPSIDTVLGGGWKKGGIGSCYGEFSSGKSTLAYQTIAYNQKINPDFCALILDQESSFTKEYALSLGCDLDRLDVIPSDEAEKNLDTLRTLINSGVYNFVLVDSSNALVPQIELSKDVSSTASVGTVAKLLSVFTRMILGSLNKTKTHLLFIEQTRSDINSVKMPGMPEKVTVGCGKAVGYYCCQRLELKRGKPITKGKDANGNDIVVGMGTKVKCVKNKVAKPMMKVEPCISYGKGYDVDLDNELFIINSGVIERLNNVKWAYTASNGEVIEIKGKDNIISTIREKGLFDEVLNKAKEKVYNNTDNNSEYGLDLLEEENKEITTED